MLARTLALAAVTFLTTAGAALAAAGGCHTYAGDFTAVAPTDCASPVGICTHGTLTGGFPSTYDFVADTLDPLTLAYTGHSTITTDEGALLFGSDSGQLAPTFPFSDFVTTVQIVDGTRQYAHATGGFVAPGTLNLLTGDTVGTYSATICLGVGAH